MNPKKIVKKIFQPFILIIKELKQVEWLSFPESIRSSVLVLVISTFIGIIIVVFDIVFYKLRDILIANA